MISIVLYGRNDSYGYNLHKRAALSLNCMAEVLTDPSDEILFVDYNTPNDFPTFPEAIQDTLTHRAKELLRIFRVRPRVHERFRTKTRLLALEPIARNVAIRRSSHSNRWILSTNTDMIFVSLREDSLSRLGERLAPGFYHTPRIEIPEVLWESLNRSDPIKVINTVRTWGANLHLNEIVLGSKIILYDGPGDFQLLLRSDLFENQGFDEDMLLGWHVDSNIAARMYLKYGRVGDLGNDVYGYHCDHTRQVTPAHSHTRLQNDWRRFVAEIARSDIPSQAQNWGCADDDIEEVRLRNEPSSVYVQALRGAIGDPLDAPHVIANRNETYNEVDYDPRHVLPFLADLFAPMSRTTNLAWFGIQSKTPTAFASVWDKLGFTGMIMLAPIELWAGAAIGAMRRVSILASLSEADAFLFDFGGFSSSEQVNTKELEIAVRRNFVRAIRVERERLSSGAAPRRVIALNAINNDYEILVTSFVAAAATPFSTHMRHGFVLAGAKQEWFPLLTAGEAGVHTGAQIRSNPVERGWVAFGQCRYLDGGRYIATVDIELLSRDERRIGNEPCASIEILAGSQLLALRLVRYGDLQNSEHRLAFVLAADLAGVVKIETRIAALAPISIALRKLSVEPSFPLGDVDFEPPDVLRIKDWLPFLRVGSLGKRVESGVIARTGPPGFVVFGPYWSLPVGRYELDVQIECRFEQRPAEGLIRADVTVANRQLVNCAFRLHGLASDEERTTKVLRLRFNLGDPIPEKRQIETRIWSSGDEEFALRSLSVRTLEQQGSEDFLPLLLTGEVGQRFDGDIRNVDQRTGLVAYSPTISLEPGGYKLSYRIVVQNHHVTEDEGSNPCAFLIVKQGSYILAVDTVSSATGQSEHKSIIFDTTSRLDQWDTVELLLHVVAPVSLRLRALAIEPAATAAHSDGLAAFEIADWLPFLQKQIGVETDLNGLLVDDGISGFVVWGPYWTLPAGLYELIAVIVPDASKLQGDPLVTLDVSSESGQRLIARYEWRLDHILSEDPHKGYECRLSFQLGDDLSPHLRTIETRISSSGGGRFHVRSLRVRSLDLELEQLAPRTRLGDVPDSSYLSARKIIRRLRSMLAPGKSKNH